MNGRDHPLTRHSREAVGAFVLVAVVVFLVAATQADRVQEWLNPGVRVRILMPPEGLYGLSAGANVEILGTAAGEVRNIVIESDQNMHAEVNLRREMMSFVRRDSEAFIKRRFGVAGDAFLEITRGTGEPLDRDYAVLTSSADRIPTQTVEQLISEVRQRAMPILDNAEMAIASLAEVAGVISEGRDDIRSFLVTLSTVGERIERGEGSVGRLLNDATLVKGLEAVLLRAEASMNQLTPILDEMPGVARNAAMMSERLGEQASAIPEVTQRASASLESLQSVLEEVRETSPQLPRLAQNVSAATEQLPELIGQTEQAIAELEGLIQQLRGSWLLGGEGRPARGDSRVSPLTVTP